MRFVEKGTAPASFDAWKTNITDEWQPAYRDLRNPEKQQLHEALLAEQGGTCCYCGRRIDAENSHIEHFEPQGTAPALALEYRNLFASCFRDQVKSVPLHCGHAKGNLFDRVRSVSPLDADCEQRFLYRLDGEIRIARETDEDAGYMIDLLKLNVSTLRNRREAALEGVFDSDFLETASVDELTRIRDHFRARGDDDRFTDLAHVIVRYTEQWLDTLRSSADPNESV